jgi:hypothetical protein
MSHERSRLLRRLTFTFLAVAGMLLASSPAHATNSFLKTWQTTYPGSATGNADCALCHGSSTGNLNAYGRALCLTFGGSVPSDITGSLRAIEAQDSDAEGHDNLLEIDANAQPGWTPGENPLFFLTDGGCAPTGSAIAVPASVPLPYDPPPPGDPVAVPGGPYAGHVNIPVTFDGTGSYDSDGGAIASYLWDFGDGTTGTGAVVQHAYAAAGTYGVSLSVVDDEGVTSVAAITTATITESALDLDIAALKVSGSVRVGKPIIIQLTVENPGVILGQAPATVVGTRSGVEVYRWTLNVYDYNGKGTTAFAFPSYTPTAKGTIAWTATIADFDPDSDTAAAITVVK